VAREARTKLAIGARRPARIRMDRNGHGAANRPRHFAAGRCAVGNNVSVHSGAAPPRGTDNRHTSNTRILQAHPLRMGARDAGRRFVWVGAHTEWQAYPHALSPARRRHCRADDNSAGLGRGYPGGTSGDRSGRDFASGGQATFRLPSPHLLALPTDATSRDELYRAFEIQLARALVSQSFGRNAYTNRLASQEIVQWELARVGLVGPSITEATRDALATQLGGGAVQPLSTISLRTNSSRTGTTGATIMSLAFAFLDQTLGAGSVERLIPAMGRSTTLGEAIHAALQVEPGTLEEAWQSYLQGVVRRQEPPCCG
jgi:hypothetical protein